MGGTACLGPGWCVRIQVRGLMAAVQYEDRLVVGGPSIYLCTCLPSILTVAPPCWPVCMHQPPVATLLFAMHRWDTTSLTESPSFSAEPSPDGPSPTCEALLQAHEQQAAAAPLPRMDRALQHEGALQQAREGAQQLLRELQEAPVLEEDTEQQQQLVPLAKPRGAVLHSSTNRLSFQGLLFPYVSAVLCCP